MKRSESVLVYGVTGVLLVILAVAIIFGGDKARGESTSLASAGIGDAVAPKPPRDLLEELLGPVDADPKDASAADKSEPVPAVELPLDRTLSVLGPSRVVEQPGSGNRYRFVQVRNGDSISALIQRWCPGNDRDSIAALNETLDMHKLQIGAEVCLPWVDDAILLEAYDARAARAQPAVERRPPVDAGAPPVAGQAPVSATGEDYVLREGESLWSIAAKKVGTKGATAYVAQILAANPSISNPDHVRAKQKIHLP